MNPVKAALRYPQVTIAITLLLVASGIYALLRMPRREDPKITIHTGIVAAIYPGATAMEMESQVARKVEERLFRMAGVRKDKTFSTSRSGVVIVNVELEAAVKDADSFWSKVRLEMAQLKATDLPDGVRGPVVDSDFGDTVAVLIAVHGGHYGYRDLKEYAQRIESKLRGIRAISKIRRLGEQKEEIEISSSLERLSQYAVNPVKIMQSLQGRNTVQFAGRVPTAQGKLPIDAQGAFQTEDQIRRVMVDVSQRGQPVYIGDLAEVHRLYKDPSEFSRVNGESALLLAVEMQEGNNIVDFGNEVRATLDRARVLLPPDLKIELVADQPRVVSERIRSFVREFGIAIVAVILVTVLLLPFRVAVVSAVAIPVTVAVTFGMLNAFGIELHQVSISALIVVLGMVVDDAIVIADNYVELLDRGMTAAQAAWQSATELAVPVLAATLTIIGSFLPLLTLSGAVGEFIRALPLAVAFALGSSFAVAMLLTPLLCRFFIKTGLHADHDEVERHHRRSPLDYMQQFYNRTIIRAMRHKKLAIAGGAIAFLAGAAILKVLPQQFFPLAERDQFVIDVWLPEGSKVEATDKAVRRVEAVLQAERGITGYSSFIGSSAPRFYYNVNPQLPAANYAQLVVSTASAEQTPRLVATLRRQLPAAAPEAKLQVKELQQGQVMEAPLEVRVSGEDTAALRRAGDAIMDVLHKTVGAIYIHTDWHEDAYRLKVDVREEVANRLGLTNGSIARQLAGAFEGAPVTTYWEGDRDIDVVLRLAPARRQSFDNVADTYVTSQLTGARVPLGSVADLHAAWEPGRIVRRNGVRTLTVRAFPEAGYLASDVLRAAGPAIRHLPLPAGYSLAFGGEYENQQETFKEMLHALLISLVVIYLILLFQFRSALDPLIVMAAIPLALPGAAVGLFLTRNAFGFTAFLGIVSLGGVVVRNAIILIDYIHVRVQSGTAIEDAALEAGERRLRPIFLTTMAAAVGVTPMILSGSSLWSPLASAIAFGLIGSMFFTLVVIPILYVVTHRAKLPSGVVTAAVLVLAVAGTCSAEPRRITLDEAVALAEKQSSVVKLANLRAREMDYRVKGARAKYLPTVSNDITAALLAETQRIDIPRGALGVFAATGPIPPVTIPIPLGNQLFGLSTTTISQPITHAFRIRAGVDAARSEAEGARQDARRAGNEVAQKVKELYYGVLTMERRSDALRLQIKAGEERLGEASNAVEAGAALRLKEVEGKAQLSQARQVLGTLEDAIADLRLEFNDLLGLPLESEVALERPTSDDNVAGLEEAVATAVHDNPEIKAAEQTVEKAHAGLRAARAEYIPEVGAFAQHIYQTGVPLLSRNNAAVGFQMKWSIFDFGKRSAAVGEREVQVAQAEENLKRLRSRVQIDLEKSMRKVRRAETAVAAANDSVAARREARRVAGDQVEAGTSNRSVVLDADGALAAAEADFLQAELGRSSAIADVRRIMGMP
jgi:multidrug efflux pump subunit AcrB/outer membrane protein TolC